MILVARGAEGLKLAEEELRAAGIEAISSGFDLIQTDKIAGWFDECVAAYGQPDIPGSELSGNSAARAGDGVAAFGLERCAGGECNGDF